MAAKPQKKFCAADSEYCPSCGEFYTTDEFNYTTGWCVSCSSSVDSSKEHAAALGKTPAFNLTSELNEWLLRHADHIEHFMLTQQITAEQAVILVRADLRPTCGVCGSQVPHGNTRTIFCSKTTQCRRAKRRYKYLYQTKGLSKAQALAQITNELQGES